MASFGLKKPDMKEFLSRKVDLQKYFSTDEIDNMCDMEKRRYENMAQNYDMMVHMGLPAIKPTFMRGPAYRAKQAKLEEELGCVSSSDSDTDDDWTPDMNKKKTNKAPVQQRTKMKTNQETSKPSPQRKTRQKDRKTENRTYELRERKANFMNLEPPDEDHFLYCEECNKEYDIDCPVHGPLDYIQDVQTTEEYDPDRALHSIPNGLVVKESSIWGAGLGVFTENEIPPRTKFGPYGGIRVTDPDRAHKSGYCWQVYENGKPSHFVDAQDKATSNWMRYVNCAVSDTDQNLVAFQYKGGIYYRSFRPIMPGQELLVWYGDEYARELGLVRDKNLLFRPSYVNGEVYYPCVFCKTSFSAAHYCVRHLMMTHGKDKLTAEDINVLDAWLRHSKFYRYGESGENGSSCTGNERHDLVKREQLEKKAEKVVDQENDKLKNRVKNYLRQTGDKNKQENCSLVNNYIELQKNLCRKSKISEMTVRFYCNNTLCCPFKKDTSSPAQTLLNNESYQCDVCAYACNVKGDLITHKRTHTGKKPYKCDVCGYACNQKGNLITHKRTHTGEKPYKCDVCGYACNQKSHLITHKRTHTGEKPYKCDVCGYACNVKGALIRHKRTHTGEKPYKCDVCGYACNVKGALIRHKRTHTGEKPYKCDVCGYACNVKDTLITHKRTHTGEKPYKCDVCGYACNQKSHLITHKRTHTGEKPYKCDVCGYACNVKGALIRHKRTHTGEKPYKCDVCGYACNVKGALIRHKRTHTGEKPYKCDVCGYACNVKDTLITHKRTHTGEKPYKCDVCGYACNRKGNLITHKRTHTGEKPYKCDVCGYACNVKGALIRHKRTHTGEKPYKCDVCGYACNRKDLLIIHKKKHLAFPS